MNRLIIIAMLCLNSYEGVDGAIVAIVSPKHAEQIRDSGAVMSLVSVIPQSKTFKISWDYTDRPNTEFIVLTQKVSPLPQPYLSFVSGRTNLVCDTVTTDWLTNGWSIQKITSTKSVLVTNSGDNEVLHAFSVVARDTQTLLYSNLATK